MWQQSTETPSSPLPGYHGIIAEVLILCGSECPGVYFLLAKEITGFLLDQRHQDALWKLHISWSRALHKFPKHTVTTSYKFFATFWEA